MFHVKHLIYLFIILPAFVFGQGHFTLPDKKFIPAAPIDSKLMDYVESQLKGKQVSDEEKQFFYWSNYLRLDPKKFYSSVIGPFLATFPEAKGKESETLRKELQSLSPLSRYNFTNLLTELALEHATDLAENSKQISHTDSRGRSFAQRMKSGGVTTCAAENIYTGTNDGLLALIMLLLDIGLESAGHRKNILNPSLTNMGLSIRPHKNEERVVLVQVFCCN